MKPLLIVCLLATACGESRPPSARASTRTLRVLPASASAVDYLCFLGRFEVACALPAQAARYSNGLDPAQATDLPSFPAFRAEPILALEPSLVICEWYQRGETTVALEARGVQVVELSAVHEFAQVGRNLVSVGTALACRERAERLAKELLRDAGAMRARDARRVLVLPYFNQGTGAYTAGSQTIEDIMLRLAGATNASAELGLTGHVQLSVEKAILAAPTWILTGEAAQLRALRESPGLRELDAVRAGRIVTLSARLRNANSPYLLDAARAVRRQLTDG